jgi:hypothetical protein
MRRLAIETIDQAIRTHQSPSGKFTDGVTTGFFAVELGLTYLELKPYLDPSTRARWEKSIQRVADWLLSSGQMTFYVNGNVNLRQTEVMWLAWAATGEQRFKTAYEREWHFTIKPPAPRWSAFGLRISRRPLRADGADGAGYLTESTTGTHPGYDPSYTMAQLDTATELYVLTRDRRYLRLMNLFFNQDYPKINSQFVLDARSGSRKNDMIPFLSPGPAVLVSSGHRPGLSSFWQGQVSEMQRDYVNQIHYNSVNYFKGTSAWLSIPALAIEWPHGMRSAPCDPRLSAACRGLF